MARTPATAIPPAGAFSLLGGVLGGHLSQAYPTLLDEIGVNGNLILLVFGIGLVHAVSTAPQGIAGQLQGLAALVRRRGPGEEDDWCSTCAT